MEALSLNRRAFLLRAGAFASTPLFVPGARALAGDPRGAAVEGGRANSTAAAMDQFVPAYMKAMNAPGLTLGWTDSKGRGGTRCYGHANVERQQPVTAEMLFQIGSISKSFLAVILLQLREEGRLDFDRPALEYMPWLPIETPFGTVTLHHMLTHTSGLPGDANMFPSNPTERVRQSYKPGGRFHYSNSCFSAMGKLVEVLEGRTYGESVQTRILDPLGMTATSPRLTELIRARTAESYTPELRDRPFPRHGKLASAPKIVSDSSAGSIASTPDDMRKYMAMLLSRGQGPQKRLLKEESFALMAHPHVRAEEFGPTASYGYGIAVDTLEGHTILRHTGGMVSFMSAMHLDIDGGYGAFASINAQLGYRPNPVAQLAIQCMRAEAEVKPLPRSPEVADVEKVKDAPEFEGTYVAADGSICRVTAKGDGLILHLDQQQVVTECLGGDRFLSSLPEYSTYAFVFRREEAKAGTTTPGPITEIVHGGRWFSRAKLESANIKPPRFAAYAGMYSNDSPWLGSFRLVERKGQLWVEGEVPLIEMGEGLFRLGDEPDSAEVVAFYHLVDGKAQLAKSGGSDFWRITTETV